MCGCEHHWDRNAPCTCTCPEHQAAREEMSRNAPMSATDHTLTDAERESLSHVVFPLHYADPDLETVAEAVESILAARLATAEAEKEALRAERDRWKVLAGNLRGAGRRTEAAEAALAGLVAAVEALAKASLRDGHNGAWVHDIWFRTLLNADHAAALRAHEAKAWDDAVTEGFDGGWLHDAARDDLLARNPYRADSIEQARP
jgi:hypothetical protein